MNKILFKPKVVLLSISFFIVFHPLTVVYLSFCSLIKAITPVIRMLCFVLINSILFNLLCALIHLLTVQPITVRSIFPGVQHKSSMSLSLSIPSASSPLSSLVFAVY